MDKNKIRILFIEDEDLLRSLFGEMFLLDEEYQYEVLSAMDVKTGLEEVTKQTPDVIILDLILPYDKNVGSGSGDLSEKMGIAVLKQVKSGAQSKEVPVIVFSNLSDVEVRREVFESGASEYLLKSETTPEKFLAVVKETVLANRK